MTKFGRAWIFGDHVNTDAIVPGRYLKLTNQQAAAHVMEGIDPEFAGKVQPGGIMVGGVNFGCGSSRENAAAAIKYAGIAAVVAQSFARIFFRNAINLGLPVVECADAGRIGEGDLVAVDLAIGRVTNQTRDEEYDATILPVHVMALLEAGGLVPYLEQAIRSGTLTTSLAPDL